MNSYPLVTRSVATRILESGWGGRHVVLLHGVGARADRWRSNIVSLGTAGHHILALDLPGHGFASKGPDFEYSVDGFAQFLGEVLSQLHIDDVSLVGTSLGGFVCARFACDYPERIESLTLVGSLGLARLGEQARSRIAAAIRDTSREGIERKLRALVRDPSLVTPEWIEEEVQVNNSSGAREAFDRLGRYFESRIDDDVVVEDLRAACSEFPILLVWGEEDQIVPPRIGEEAVSSLSGARWRLIPETGHAPYLERPEQFNEVLAEFLGPHQIETPSRKEFRAKEPEGGSEG